MILNTIKLYSGLKQKQLAELMGISEAKLSVALKGTQPLSAESCGILIKEFNLNPKWFFGFEGKPDEIMFMDDVVPRQQYEALLEEKQSLVEELLQAYRNQKKGDLNG